MLLNCHVTDDVLTSRDVTPRDQRHDPNTLIAQYHENSWIIMLFSKKI